jgi:DNA-binding NarL/FixJ family response regulator
MNLFSLKYLIILQITIDLAIFVVFVLLMIRLKSFNKNSSLNEKLEQYESLLTDAADMSERFNKMLQEKKDIVIQVNEHLDNRIKNLHAMLNRTDALLFNHRSENQDHSDQNSLKNHNKEILKLAREGFDPDYIADSLFISKEEVMLVLDLKKKISKKDFKEDIS